MVLERNINTPKKAVIGWKSDKYAWIFNERGPFGVSGSVRSKTKRKLEINYGALDPDFDVVARIPTLLDSR
jgi:hypothetical protein